MPDVSERFHDMRRWVKDQFSSDGDVTNPKSLLKHANENMLQMNAAERTRTIDHLNANAIAYYNGRHNEQIPEAVRSAMRQLERRADRLNLVDQAKAKLEKYGGPPTKETILDSVERSYKERSKYRTQEASLTHERTGEKTREQLQQVAAQQTKSRTREHVLEKEA